MKYGSTSVQVSDGQTINLPANVAVTITFPEVEGYLAPEPISFTHSGGLSEKTGTYQCELLTVNVTADSGTPTGFEVTISKQETVGVATKYTRLEYIESTGTQYIDTNYIFTSQNIRVLLDFEYTGSFSTASLYGSNSSQVSGDRFSIAPYSSPTSFFVGSSHGLLPLNMSQNVRYILDAHAYNGTLDIILDGAKSTGAYSGSLDNSDKFVLFAYNYKGTVKQYVSARFYSCKIYDNGTLVRDYIPALRSDGIAGLYDAVNDTFYASAGSGNFIAGSASMDVIASQTSASGTYKIPFNTGYTVQSSKVNGYNTPGVVTRVASEKIYTVTQQYTVITEIDLSLKDVYGNDINRSTANCYVVREPGTYKFPLVYGNAIKNGKVNTAAFTNNGGTYSHNFVDGYSPAKSITTPYLEDHYANPSEFRASVVTEDYGSITNVEIIDGDICKFIRFKVTGVPNTGANAIIRLTVMGSLWSWHIWLWPHDLTPVEITNATGVKYNIMPVNLASKYDDDGVHIKNWFYQWGRPMPLLCPSAYNSTTDHSPGNITKSSKASNLSEGLADPTTFFYNSSSPYNWFGDKSYYNLWDAACTGTGNSDNDTVKTVYDPCPVGWKIPNGNVFTGLKIISNANGIVKVTRYSGDTVGVGFPFSGRRDLSDGSLLGVGSGGYVWRSSANSETLAGSVYFYYSPREESYYVDYLYSSARAYGYSVRPVQDDNIQLDVIMISFKIGGTSFQAESGMTLFEWVYSSYNTAGFYVEDGLIYESAGSKSISNGSLNTVITGGFNFTLDK